MVNYQWLIIKAISLHVCTCIETHRNVYLRTLLSYDCLRQEDVRTGDDVRRIVGKGGCFPLWTPLDGRYRLYTLQCEGRHETSAEGPF